MTPSDPPLLAHALVTAPDVRPTRWMLFLHGILGSGQNFRTIARKLVAARPTWGAVLVDLRMHGRSVGFDPPHDLEACASDLRRLSRTLPGRAQGVVGHSFGGKVALELIRGGDHSLSYAWILDSTPSARPDGRASESTIQILSMLERMAHSFPTREAFIDEVMKNGQSNAIAAWLAMQVKALPDGGYAFALDLDAIRAMMNDYFARDEWIAVEDPRLLGMDLVIGGRSQVLDDSDRQRAADLAREAPARLHVHVIPGAGHWVHVDAPDEVFHILESGTPT